MTKVNQSIHKGTIFDFSEVYNVVRLKVIASPLDHRL